VLREEGSGTTLHPHESGTRPLHRAQSLESHFAVSAGRRAFGYDLETLKGRGFALGEKFLRLYATAGTIDRQADAEEHGSGRFGTRSSGFRPVVLDAAITANWGDLAAILACYATREHYCTSPFGPDGAAPCRVWKRIMQTACQNLGGGCDR
jgi:hypothetical protein